MHPLLDKCQRRGWCLPAWFLFSAGLAACSLSGHAQERLKTELLKQYGGIYSSACDKVDAPRLRVLPDALVVQHAGRRITGRKPQSAYAYYGKTAPPQFRVGLMSQVAGGGTLDFLVFEDKRGPYISVLGDKLVQADLGKALTSPRYRRCEDTPAQAAARAAPPIPSQDEPASEAEKMLLDPQFKSAYLRALGPLARERWLARLEGPRPPTRQVRLEGVDYTLVAVCKPHECTDHNTALLYAANTPSEQAVVFGKIVQDGRSTLIGDPPPAIAAALDSIWATEWKRK